MRNVTAPLPEAKHRSSGWRFVVYLVLLVFTLQSYVIQSHIHDQSQGAGIFPIAKVGAARPSHGKTPIDDGPSNCSICQAIVHAGAFLAPGVFLLLPALSAELAAPFVTKHAVTLGAWHGWQSRAPPRH